MRGGGNNGGSADSSGDGVGRRFVAANFDVVDASHFRFGRSAKTKVELEMEGMRCSAEKTKYRLKVTAC